MKKIFAVALLAVSLNAIAETETYCPVGVALPDSDGDGVPNLCDNCRKLFNPEQADADHDGYGNLCDADLNNRGRIVNSLDRDLFLAAIGTNDPEADFDGSGTVDSADLVIFNSLLGKAPGPSGRRGKVNTFQATPAEGYKKLVPVVIINFIPTQDGVHINRELWEGRPWALPSAWGDTLLISDVRTYIRSTYDRIKFGLEEGSRFRGYKDANAIPYLGYKVIAVYNFYDEMKPGAPYGTPGDFLPDLHDIMARIPAMDLVEVQGAKEFWVNIYEMWGEGNIIFPESNMSSPITGDISNSFRIPDDLPIYSKSYVVYGTNYFRTQSEALHNHGHQLEAILSNANIVQDGNKSLFWDSFVGRDGTEEGYLTGRCGWTHMPPNTVANYDYYNPAQILSDCEDWTPTGTGQQTLISVDTWVDKNYSWPTEVPFAQQGEAQFYIYWMQNMPGFKNKIPYDDNTMENWWIFTADWDAAVTAEKGLHR